MPSVLLKSAFGVNALYFTTGSLNTSIGNRALLGNNTGSGNTTLGANADVLFGNLTNATAIGYNAKVNASNKIRLGNSTVTVIEGQVAYTFPSDGRFKTAISETVKGLDFIMKLRPVVYNFQTKKYDDFIRGEGNKNVKFASSIDYTESEKIRHNGFIAQDVEKAAKETGYEFDGVVVPKTNKEAYGLSYSQFVVPLVKAVQELNIKVEKLEKENELLKTNKQVDPHLSGEIPMIVRKQQKMIEQLQQLVLQQQKDIEKLKKKIGE